MDRDAIVAVVGAERYRALCLAAREAALLPSDERPRRWSENDIDAAHNIGDSVWESALPDAEKMALLFLLYREMPSYSLIYNLPDRYPALSPAAKAALWEEVRELLSGDDAALSAAREYSMWCDFFENPRTVGEAWAELTRSDADPKLLQRILIASGPVPFPLKAQVYQRLIGDVTWHYYIYRSLLHSRFDVYGQIDSGGAREIVERLRLPENTSTWTGFARLWRDRQV